MCGIAGFLDRSARTGAEELSATAQRMADTLRHRGPDDSGVWVDARAGVALGHRRLSIIDLSAEGRQPMHSADDRYVVSFNGETYNHQALRRELQELGHSFRGHSDTEVMLAAITEWGLEPALGRFVGMFGFALWDRTERALYLVRDRLGIKPLYYGWCGSKFLFGSELKALRAHPAFKAEVDRNALALYLRHSYIPVPYSVYKGISKLPPGTLLRIDRFRGGKSETPTPYWSAREVAEANGTASPPLPVGEALEELERVLADAVKLRMVADVPLGAFLSGGIDSSTVVALMQSQSTRPVKTFTIGFSEGGYNEADNARAVAQHLGTEHSELYVTPEQAMQAIPRLPRLYDEPFSDVSQIPMFLVSELARRDVTVALSGDGGDELFAGYNRYSLGKRIWNGVGWMPRTVRGGLAALMTALSPETWTRWFDRLGWVLPRKVKQRNPGDKLHKLATVLAAESREAMYLNLVSHWRDPTIVREASEPVTPITDRSLWARLPHFVELMMYLDQITYLPDDILVKLDRASMGVSLEARVPLLDHRVVEFAWRVPLSMKIREGQSKWLLRQLLYRHVPRELIDRQKMGFGVPIGDWLRGPLRDWAASLLAEERLRREDFFDPQPIREKWDEHQAGKRSWQHYLWDVLMFQAWLETWG